MNSWKNKTCNPTMPSQAQNKTRKTVKGGRRFTTISFESLERINHGVFTEDISSSSRISRPSFVLRQGDVVGANMPETIKLANHRGKIYVGLSETSSMCSGRRESRSVSKEISSATTTIGRASIIDWADNASDVSGKVPLSGDLTTMLPPVQKLQQSNQPPPGLDMTDIFNYKTTKYISTGVKKHGQQASRVSQSRSGARALGGFRPPQNTPFMFPTRPDEFSASIRKKITPRSPRDNVSVMVLGGSITPVPPSRQDTQRSFMSRESTMTDRRIFRKSRQSVTSIGKANFDLPMIDLKCVESPIGNLGNLEEKGIRLVKLRRVKRTRKKSELQNSEGKGGGVSSPNTPTDDNASSLNGETGKELLGRSNTLAPLALPTTREVTINKTPGGETLEGQKTDNEKRPEEKNNSRSPRSATSSTNSEGFPHKTQNAKESEVGSNHDHYSTPLLPDTGRSTFRNEKQSKPTSPVIQINSEPVKKPSPVFQMTVEKVDATPQPPTPPRLPVSESEDEDFRISGRRGKRSSSLLSVPTSDILSEGRPRLPAELDIRENPTPLKTEEEETDLHSRTIATQTNP